MKEATGIDLANIINADSYEAKVNRNVNLSGLDSVNLNLEDHRDKAEKNEKKQHKKDASDTEKHQESAEVSNDTQGE